MSDFKDIVKKFFSLSLLALTLVILFMIPGSTVLRPEDKNSFHSFALETGVGHSPDGVLSNWELSGWVGGDYHKLLLKTKGKNLNGELQKTESRLGYGHNIADDWDIQIGMRHDSVPPEAQNYAVLGLKTVGPYSIEIEAYLFATHKEQVSSRIEATIEFSLTQMLMIESHIEFDMFLQDIPEQDIDAGLASTEISFMLIYELIHEFTPYLELSYEKEHDHDHSDNDEKDYHYRISIGAHFLF